MVLPFNCSCSVSKSYMTLCDPHRLQARLSCPLLPPRGCSNSCPLSWWCFPNILSPAAPFSFCLQSFPASGSFPKSRFFTSGDQNIGASALTSVLPKNIHGWFLLGLINLISLQSKGLSKVFRTTILKNQFFSTQASSWSSSHIHTWLLEKS